MTQIIQNRIIFKWLSFYLYYLLIFIILFKYWSKFIIKSLLQLFLILQINIESKYFSMHFTLIFLLFMFEVLRDWICGDLNAKVIIIQITINTESAQFIYMEAFII